MLLSLLRRSSLKDLLLMTPAMRLTEGPRVLRGLEDARSRAQLSALLEATAAMHSLQQRRVVLQTMPFQTRWEVGAELGSIVVCAAAGGLSASLHPGFLSLFGVAFVLYRKSTRSIRQRQAAQVELGEVTSQIRDAAKILKKTEQELGV